MLNGSAEARYSSDISRLSDRVFDIAITHAKEQAISASAMESVAKNISGINDKIKIRDRLIVTVFSILCGLHLPVSIKVIVEFVKYLGILT